MPLVADLMVVRASGAPVHLPMGSIPGMPTIGKDVTTGQWKTLTDEIIYYYRKVAAEAINEYTDKIAAASLLEVPRRSDELAKSIRHPKNDPASRATAEHLEATVSYNTEYADVQHEGVWTMMHEHPIIPGKLGFFERVAVTKNIVVEWKAEEHTTPGTKDHFLSDPFKAMVNGLDDFVYLKVRASFLGAHVF